jgi:hypothetical protein
MMSRGLYSTTLSITRLFFLLTFMLLFLLLFCFGLSNAFFQVTFQGRDVAESRHLYDQLAVMAPIMLALTAATPIHKGKLADWVSLQVFCSFSSLFSHRELCDATHTTTHDDMRERVRVPCLTPACRTEWSERV